MWMKEEEEQNTTVCICVHFKVLVPQVLVFHKGCDECDVVPQHLL